MNVSNFDENSDLNLSSSQRRDLVFSELKRKSRLRVIFKDCPFSEMEEIFERFKAVLDERRQEEQERDARDVRLAKEAQSILGKMAEKGIDIDVLTDLHEKGVGGLNTKVKYIKDGVTWSGKGRRPQPFKGLSDYELERYRKPLA